MTLPIMVKDLSFRYQGSKKEILTGINITVNQGEILAIVGLSGSGKSTLCYCISGIIPHIYQGELSGEVLLKGSSTRSLSLPRIATQLGIVFQNPETQLFFPIVEDEVAFGPENLCLAREEIGQRLAQVLELTGMERQRYSNPQHLSGGQKQLIALSSVLSLQPDILVFDEVMAQLDPAGKELIKNMILNLKEQDKTVIMIDHDCDNLVIADKVKILKQGRLLDFDGTFS